MRAMLALNGLEAITQRAQLPDGRVVNRAGEDVTRAHP